MTPEERAEHCLRRMNIKDVARAVLIERIARAIRDDRNELADLLKARAKGYDNRDEALIQHTSCGAYEARSALRLCAFEATDCADLILTCDTGSTTNEAPVKANRRAGAADEKIKTAIKTAIKERPLYSGEVEIRLRRFGRQNVSRVLKDGKSERIQVQQWELRAAVKNTGSAYRCGMLQTREEAEEALQAATILLAG